MKTLLALISSVAVAATAGSIFVAVQIGIFEKHEEPFDLNTIPVDVTLNDFNGVGGTSKSIKIKSIVFKEMINNPLMKPTIDKLGGVEKFKEVFDKELGLYDSKGTLKTKPEISVKEGSIYTLRVSDDIEIPTFKGELKITFKKGNVSVQHHYDLMSKQEKQNLSNLILGRNVLDERVASTKEIIVNAILSDLNIDPNTNIKEKVEGEFSNTIDSLDEAGEIITQKIKSDSEVILYNTYEKKDEIYKLGELINFSTELSAKSVDLGITTPAKLEFDIKVTDSKLIFEEENSSKIELNYTFEELKKSLEKFLYSIVEVPEPEEPDPEVPEKFDPEEGHVSATARLKIFAEAAKESIKNEDSKKEKKEFDILTTNIYQSIDIAEGPNADDPTSELQLTNLIESIWKYFDSEVPVKLTGGFDLNVTFEVTPINIVDLLEILKQNLFENISKGKLVQGQSAPKMSNNIYSNEKLTEQQIKTEKENLEYWLNLKSETENPYFHLINEFLDENKSFNTSLFEGRELDDRPTEPSPVKAGQEYTTLTGLYINLSGYQNGEESEFVSMQNQDATVASIYFSNSSINKESVIVYYG